jgi:hypothetical protein
MLYIKFRLSGQLLFQRTKYDMVRRKWRRRFTNIAILLVLVLAANGRAKLELEFPGPAPGAAQCRITQDQLVLENTVLACSWDISEGQLKSNCVVDKLSATTYQLAEAECFQLVLPGEQKVNASELKIVSGPVIQKLEPSYAATRLASQFGGSQITVILASPDGNLRIEWRAILRDGSNYVRQQVAFMAKNEPIEAKEIVLLELTASNAKVMGSVDGSPVAAGNVFFAYEHPLTKSQILQEDSHRFRCSLPYGATLKPGERLVQSSVVGVVPQGQLRRGFLYYIERERAYPYRPFLHYNSWYDIGYGAEKIQEPESLEVIRLFGEELIKQRKVVIDSFALDDGWDDPASLWQFHSGFPDGFSHLQEAADKYGSALGAWLSPFGGYGTAKQARLKYGREQGFETNKSGFSLAGPTYYDRFRDVCVRMIREYGLNYFKFDGIGTTGRPTGPAPEFVNDMEALMQLVGDLRQAKQDVFINITSGMWTSPFWLWYGDSVWRSGRDWGTHGAGSKRQQQVTYRDKETYHNVVKRSPLHPLNSLMTQGIMFANHGLPNEAEDLVSDIHTFFASGTNCQELYITPSLLDSHTWDALAEAAKWSRNNADVLVDTHWVGADPAKGQVYGWASWSKRKGILSLRNPKDGPGKITLDISKVFELPKGAVKKYSLSSPWKKDADKAAITLAAGKEHTFELEPFEVLVFDATPL